MNEFEKRVERRARVIWEMHASPVPLEWGKLIESAKDYYRTIVRATFTADTEDGYVLVKREATEAMVEAGHVAQRDSTKPAPFNQIADGINAAIAAGAIEEGE